MADMVECHKDLGVVVAEVAAVVVVEVVQNSLYLADTIEVPRKQCSQTQFEALPPMVI